jgi:uncharacterized protein YjiS (DUF1127 family)
MQLGARSRIQEFHMRTVSLETATIAPQKVRRRAGRLSARQALSWIFARLRAWRQRSRGRAELARLDERMLRDIGITPGDVWEEINKPFWRK